MPVDDPSSLTYQQIQQWMQVHGEPAFRGRQLFKWLHQHCAQSYAEMTNLSKAFREKLSRQHPMEPVRIVEEQLAADGTRKFRFGLRDGRQVEGVFMPEKERSTFCVSTQVGCAMGCSFCATAGMGLLRSLSAGEIVGQLEAVIRHLGAKEGKRVVSNVVFMGMGEPLANLEAVVAAVDILLHPQGQGLSRRHVTVSTVGLVRAIEQFVARAPVKLAVSLNATTDEQRSRLMPVNRKYPIAELIRCCRNLPLAYNDRVTFEYVLLAGVNDQLQDAHRLVKLLSGFRAKVNLIPYNGHPDSPYQRPAEAQVLAFQEVLVTHQITAFVRRSRGEELRAACGQLVTERNDS